MKIRTGAYYEQVEILPTIAITWYRPVAVVIGWIKWWIEIEIIPER